MNEFVDLAISVIGEDDIITGRLSISPEISKKMEEESFNKDLFVDAAEETLKSFYPYEGIYLSYNNISLEGKVKAHWQVDFVVFPWLLYGQPHNTRLYFSEILNRWKINLEKREIVTFENSEDNVDIKLGRISQYFGNYRNKISLYIDELVKEPIERLNRNDITDQEIEDAIALVNSIPEGFHMYRLLGMISRRIIGQIRIDYSEKLELLKYLHKASVKY